MTLLTCVIRRGDTRAYRFATKNRLCITGATILFLGDEDLRDRVKPEALSGTVAIFSEDGDYNGASHRFKENGPDQLQGASYYLALNPNSIDPEPVIEVITSMRVAQNNKPQPRRYG